MAFTEYRLNPEYIRAKTAEKAAGLKANRGLSDLLGFGLSVIDDRLAKDRRRYRDYGPYWFALKDVMNAHGRELGEQSDPLAAKVYRGVTETETMIAADEFRTEYLRTQMVGTNRFILDGSTGEWWTLYDDDMESPAG